MKKVFIPLLILIVLATTSSIAWAAPSVAIDGKILQTKAQPIIKNNIVYVPIKDVFESLGYIVTWSEEQKIIAIGYPNNSGYLNISMIDGTTYTSFLNKYVTINPPPIYSDSGSAMIPFQHIRLITGLPILWDSEKSTAFIFTKPPQTPTKQKPIISGPLYLVANDNKGTYLGKLTTNKFDADSIFNDYGTYGSKYNQNSIWNDYGTFGGKFSAYSPFNEFSATPPLIVDSNGNIVGRLTVNKFVQGAISPYTITGVLKDLGL